jgi:hypothetical protein
MNSKLKIDNTKLFDSIKSVVLQIETELYEINKSGIFFAPELYLAFEIGKALFREREAIFGTIDLEWIRERNLGNGGPSDLIFECGNEKIVFEFKIASTYNDYERDVIKLQKLLSNDKITYHKFFVALIDHFPNKYDGRIDYLEKSGLRCLGNKDIEVKYSGYRGNVNCNLVFYEVK